MSSFRSRFQQTPSRLTPQDSEYQDGNVRLRMSSSNYRSEAPESAYLHRQAENQRIKELSFWDNVDQQGEQEEEWSDRQSPLPFILIAICLVVASTLLWFLFKWMTGENSGAPVIIAADTAPFKVRPENPGGMMIPHQDKLVYGRLRQDTNQPMERLLPLPEQPMAPPHQGYSPQPPLQQAPQMPEAGQQPYGPQTQSYYPPPQQGYPQSPSSQQTHQPPYGERVSQNPLQHSAPQPLPSPQEQVVYPQQNHYQSQQPYPQAPDSYQAPYGGYPQAHSSPVPSGQQVPFKQPDQEQAPESPPVVSAVEEIKPAVDEETSSEKEPPHNASINTLDQLIANEVGKSTKNTNKEDGASSKKPSPIAPNKHKVQIASLPSRAMAEQEMRRLRNNHSSLFQNKPWDIQKITLGPNRGVTHRLVIGSFSNRDSAAKFCKRLQSEKVGCKVISPVNE